MIEENAEVGQENIKPLDLPEEEVLVDNQQSVEGHSQGSLMDDIDAEEQSLTGVVTDTENVSSEQDMERLFNSIGIYDEENEPTEGDQFSPEERDIFVQAQEAIGTKPDGDFGEDSQAALSSYLERQGVDKRVIDMIPPMLARNAAPFEAPEAERVLPVVDEIRDFNESSRSIRQRTDEDEVSSSSTILGKAMAGKESNSNDDVYAKTYWGDSKPSEMTISEVITHGDKTLVDINAGNKAIFDGEDFSDEDRKFKAEHSGREVFDEYPDSGYIIPSSASGKYQMLGTSIEQAMEDAGVSETDTFDEATQDKLAFALMKQNKDVLSFLETGKNKDAALKGMGAIWESFDLDLFPNNREHVETLLDDLRESETQE